MYGPKGMNRSGFGAFTAAKRAQAALDAAPVTDAPLNVPAEETVPPAPSVSDDGAAAAPTGSAGASPTSPRLSADR